MLRERIISRMHETHQTQRSLSRGTGIEYTAINTFLNGHKGMWFYRIQQILDYLNLSAEGSVPSPERKGIQHTIWVELRCRKLKVKDIADRLDVSYGSLNSFVTNKGGMSVYKVEQLMNMLGIELRAKAS